MLVGPVGVDERDVRDERAARDERLAVNGSSKVLRFSFTSIRSVPSSPRVGSEGRFRAPAASRALSAVSESSSTRTRPSSTAFRYCWQRPKVSIETAAPMKRSMRAGRGEPVDRHPADEADEAEPALLLPDQLADERHRRRLGRHVLEGDDVPVGDEPDRLLERPHLAHATRTISSPPWISTSWPVM